jgi:hypothetical protein
MKMANCTIQNNETGEIIDLGDCETEYECNVKALEYVNKKERQERACKKAEQWAKDVFDYAHRIGETQRRFKKTGKV